MVILIMGASHTGKTLLAQKMLERYHYPVLSVDHLKMGLIRSGKTKLTPEEDSELMSYLWSIVKEIIKTVIENNQNLIIEGAYFPFNWEDDFEKMYLENIKYLCLVMTKEYIQNHFDEIKEHASIIEKRGNDDWCTLDMLVQENQYNYEMCLRYQLTYILINHEYCIESILNEFEGGK